MGPRSELDATRAERDAWRRRAEAALRERGGGELGIPRRPGRFVRRLFGATFLAVVLTLSGGLLIGRPAAVRSPDYLACIGKARYENPIQDNQYQELVNALYTCDVYGAG